jgi:hypothetical protein
LRFQLGCAHTDASPSVAVAAKLWRCSRIGCLVDRWLVHCARMLKQCASFISAPDRSINFINQRTPDCRYTKTSVRPHEARTPERQPDRCIRAGVQQAQCSTDSKLSNGACWCFRSPDAGRSERVRGLGRVCPLDVRSLGVKRTRYAQPEFFRVWHFSDMARCLT